MNELQISSLLLEEEHRAQEERAEYLFHEHHVLWLPVIAKGMLYASRVRAQENYKRHFVGTRPIEVPAHPDIGDPLCGNFGLTRTNDCWVLWELGFDGEGALNGMGIMHGDVKPTMAKAIVGACYETPGAILEAMLLWPEPDPADWHEDD